MPFKVTLIMQDATGAAAGDPTVETRVGGFTESYYSALATPTAVVDLLINGSGANQSILRTRAGLLPSSGQIIGYRLAAVLPRTGRAQTKGVSYPGVSFWTTDLPQVSVQYSINSTSSGNIRRAALRCVPDQFVHGGEFQPDDAYTIALAFFAGSLSDWRFLGQDLTTPYTDVSTITAAGVVTFLAPVTIPAGTTVQFKGLLEPITGTKFSIRSKVRIGALAGTQITLLDWQSGDVQGGQGRQIVYNLYGMDSTSFSVERATVRKVGRPFFQFRGRRSKRRVR